MRAVSATMARLWALVMSLISPVSPMENSVMGMSRALPPPAAVPLMFMVGPPEGCRMQPPTFKPRLAQAFQQAAGGGALALAQRSGGDAGDLYILAVGLILQPVHDLGVVQPGDFAVGDDLVLSPGPASSCQSPGCGMFFSASSAICQSLIFKGHMAFSISPDSFNYLALYIPARSADSIVFCSSMVTVIGPTPPGTGVMAAAFSLTASKSTSPTSR